MWENGGPGVDLNALVEPGATITVGDVNYINDRGEIAVTGTLPNGDQHAILLVPDGDCDDACDARIAASQSSAVSSPNVATRTRISESNLSPVEKSGMQMRQRFHMPGQVTPPNN